MAHGLYNLYSIPYSSIKVCTGLRWPQERGEPFALPFLLPPKVQERVLVIFGKRSASPFAS